MLELFTIRDLDSGLLIGFDLDVETCDCCGTTITRDYTTCYPTIPAILEDTREACQSIIDTSVDGRSFPYQNVEIVQMGVLND